MTTLEIPFVRLSENATLPTKAHETDSGFDLYTSEGVSIISRDTMVISTDIAIILPKGYEAQIRPRSGVTSKTDLRVQLGTIDNGYRGKLGIITDNISEDSIYIQKGFKLAQLVVQPIPNTKVVEYTKESLNKTDRGVDGFGSSGV